MVWVVLNEMVDDGVAVKMSSDQWELNVLAPPLDLVRLYGIRDADWDTRRSLEIGTSANASVFWAMSHIQGEVNVFVGHDQETWDIGVTVPLDTVLEIARQAEEHIPPMPPDQSTAEDRLHNRGPGKGAIPLW